MGYKIEAKMPRNQSGPVILSGSTIQKKFINLLYILKSFISIMNSFVFFLIIKRYDIIIWSFLYWEI
jgi:hypothetical protein